MGRFRESSEGESEPGIDMSPMIDCVFILLIFFIVTTTFVEETGIEVDKPEAASSVQLEKTSMLFAITAQGGIYYGGRDIGIGGVLPQVKRTLQSAREEVPVIIQADTAAPAGLLVRVIGQAKLGGAEKVSVSADRPQG